MKIKDLMKPPLYVNSKGHVQDTDGCYSIFIANSIYGSITEQEIRNWIISAIEKKWERDYGEPERWVPDTVDYEDGGMYDVCMCPVCEYMVDSDLILKSASPYCYCPACGLRLLLPKETEE